MAGTLQGNIVWDRQKQRWQISVTGTCISLSSFCLTFLLTLDQTITGFNDQGKKPFENIIAGKGENAGNQHFPLFLTMFSILNMTSANAFIFVKSKNLLFGKKFSNLLFTLACVFQLAFSINPMVGTYALID